MTEISIRCYKSKVWRSPSQLMILTAEKVNGHIMGKHGILQGILGPNLWIISDTIKYFSIFSK